MNLQANLNNGTPLRRRSWVQGVFIFRQIPSIIDLEIVPKMQSLPIEVKDIFSERLRKELSETTMSENMGLNDLVYSTINYKYQIALVDNNNNISSYNMSSEDLLADDWETYKSC